MKRDRSAACARRLSSGKDALQIVPLHLPHPILGGPPCPSRREARPCERHRTTSAVPAESSMTPCSRPSRPSPPGRRKGAGLDRHCARQHGFVQAWDEGMIPAEQRMAGFALYRGASIIVPSWIALDVRRPNREAADQALFAGDVCNRPSAVFKKARSDNFLGETIPKKAMALYGLKLSHFFPKSCFL